MGEDRVRTQGLTKRYLLGEGWGSRTTLRDVLAAKLRRGDAGARSEVVAVEDVTITVAEGDCVGLVGPNGAGKSTLLKLIAGITRPSTGSASTRGRVGSLLEVGAGFHPELTGRENVHLNAAILGMSRREVAARFDDIVALSGVEPFLDTPVKRYSSGMYLRLAFGVAANVDADVLVVDEVLAVGDAEFQRRCLHRLDELNRQGRTILFASHDLDAVARLCRRCLHLERGAVVADGPAADVTRRYLSARIGRDRAPIGDRTGVLRDVRVLSAAQGTPQAGEPFAVEVEVLPPPQLTGLQLGVRLSTLAGARIVDEVTTLPAPGASVTCRLRLTIPGLLSPGAYVVAVWIGTLEHDLVWEDDAVTFQLDGPTDGRPDRALTLASPWTVL